MNREHLTENNCNNSRFSSLSHSMLHALRSVLGAWCLVLLLFFASTALAAEPAPKAPSGGFGVSLGPSKIRFSGAPGETQQSSVRIWNQSQNSMRFMLEIADLGNEVDKAGKLNRVFAAPGSLAHSCASWIQIEQNELTVQAGGFQDVKFLLAVPPDAVGGHAAVIFFRGVPAAAAAAAEADPSKSTTIVQIQPRIGVLIFHEASGTVQRTGRLEDFKAEAPLDGEPLRMTYTFENTGNVDILLGGSFYLLGENNALAAKGSINTLRSFPGDHGQSETVWEGVLDPGKYHLVASFELGPDGQEVIVREADLEVTESV